LTDAVKAFIIALTTFPENNNRLEGTRKENAKPESLLHQYVSANAFPPQIISGVSQQLHQSMEKASLLRPSG
jgi:hypothetical protein